jgi:hypothetical protein
MILLQETEQSVPFDPVVVCGPPPWYERLFAFYLIFMVLVLAARGMQLLWNLARLRRLQREADPKPFSAVVQAAHARADSLKRFSVLTLVLTLADFCFATAGMFTRISAQRTSGYAAVSGAAAIQLQITAFGLLLCAALYAAAFFFQARLARRERAFAEQTGANSPQSPAEPTSL